jgi:hypothetical protein
MFFNCSMNLQKNSIIVIQTTEGRKNLDDIKVDVFEILRFALNDKFYFLQNALKSQ